MSQCMDSVHSSDGGAISIDISEVLARIKSSLSSNFVSATDLAFSARLEKALQKNFEYIKRYIPGMSVRIEIFGEHLICSIYRQERRSCAVTSWPTRTRTQTTRQIIS